MRHQHTLISPPASSRSVAAIMRANRKCNSGPELVVRKILHTLGYRYRLHARDLPGNPDIVLRKRRKVIFVHGCFWHQHQDNECPLQSHPKTNVHYWQPKLLRNRERDRVNEQKIAEIGWKALIVWECELADKEALKSRLEVFLESRQINPSDA